MPGNASGAPPTSGFGAGRPGAVVIAWVAQLGRPLIPTEQRLATEARLVAAATGRPEWVAAVLGGVVADLVAVTPADDRVRSLAARIGPLALAGPAGEPAPDADGVTPGPGGLPAAFTPSDDTDEAMVAREVFPVALPTGAAVTLALAGAGAGALSAGRVRTPVLEAAADTPPWRGALAGLPLTDPPALLARPWVAAAAGLLLTARRGLLDAELSSIADRLTPDTGDDAGRALAIAGTSAVRWALWHRWQARGDRWVADRLPLTSARRWTDLAELAELTGGGLTLDEHWGSPPEFRSVADDRPG